MVSRRRGAAEETFRKDVRLDDVPAWEIVSTDGALLAFGRYYLRLGRCHLGFLAVAPEVRGRGIGLKLVEDLCAEGERNLSFDEYSLFFDEYSLFVWQDNAIAVGLYRKLGFVEAPYPEPSSGLAGMVYMIRGKTGH